MSRQSPLTYDDVAGAADALLAQGESVTLDKLHQQLARGSKTTIQKHRTVWLQRGRGNANGPTPAPSPVNDAIEQFRDQLWREALDEAHASLGKEREAGAAEVRQANEQAEAAEHERQIIIERTTALQVQLESLHAELIESRCELGSQREKRAALEATLDATQQNAQAQEHRFEHQLTQLHEQLASSEQRHEAGVAQLAQHIDALKKAASERHTQSASALQRLDRKGNQMIRSLETAFEKERRARESIAVEAASKAVALEKVIETQAAKLAARETTIARLETELKALERERKRRDGEHKALTSAHERLITIHTHIGQQLKDSAHRVEILSETVNTVTIQNAELATQQRPGPRTTEN